MKLLLSILALQSFLISLVSADGSLSFISYAQTNETVHTIYTQLAVANGSVYFGDIKYSTYSEPLILGYPGNAPGNTGGMSFTSFHTAPTGWQRFYIYPNDAKPVGFTQPHSATIPAGAATSNFSVSTTDSFVRYNNLDNWYGCPIASPTGTYQVYYVGEGKEVPAGCVKIDILAYGFGNCPW